MWALVNKDGFVIDCLVGISFEEAKKYEVDGRFLVEMTLENSPANLGSYYDGKAFSILDRNYNTPVGYDRQVYTTESSKDN
jgi:hypothetical protein